MNELKRIFNQKTIFLLVILVIINAGLFMMSFSTEKDITLTGKELESYIDGYHEFLEMTKENSNNMSMLNMYRDGFVADNIRKTALAYSELENITVSVGENRGIVLFLEYKLTDVIIIAFLMIMSVRFLKERKKGVVNLIRSTAKGRGVLYFSRVGILLFSSVVLGMVMYGVNFIVMMISFEQTDVSRMVQSLPEFMQCHYAVTIWEYILISLTLKISAYFLLGLMFYTVISILETGIAYTVTAVFIIAEFLLYNLIIPVSSINFFKYINIVSLINCEDFLSVCQNINIFGVAVPVLNCNIFFITVTAFLLVICGSLIHNKMYIRNKGIFKGISEKAGSIAEKFAFQRTLTGWESYKLLVKQGGLIFLIVAFFLALSSAMKYDYIYKINFREQTWYEKYEGVITEETLINSQKKLKSLEDRIKSYQDKVDNMMLQENYNQNTLSQYMQYIGELTEEREALLPVAENIRDGYEYTQRTGNKINLIQPYSYDLLLNKDKQTQNRASLYILIGIIAVVSGVFAYDRQNNMDNTLKSSRRGRGLLAFIKISVVCAVSIFVCISIHLIQFVQIGNFLEYNNMDVPVQSLMFMRDFEIYMSIGEFLILLFVVRAVFACIIGGICALISRVSADTMTATVVSLFILAVPSVFSEIMPGDNFVSCVYLLSGEIIV